MDSSTTWRLRRTWRRLATITALAVACAAALTTMAAPAHALSQPWPGGGESCTYASERPYFAGWADLDFRGCLGSGQATTADCKAMTAYRWTGRAWQAQSLNECNGTAVYVYPYAAGWSWVWTQRTGWLAVPSNKVIVARAVGIASTTGTHTAH